MSAISAGLVVVGLGFEHLADLIVCTDDTFPDGASADAAFEAAAPTTSWRPH